MGNATYGLGAAQQQQAAGTVDEYIAKRMKESATQTSALKQVPPAADSIDRTVRMTYDNIRLANSIIERLNGATQPSIETSHLPDQPSLTYKLYVVGNGQDHLYCLLNQISQLIG